MRGKVEEVAVRVPWRGGAWVYTSGVFKEEAEGRVLRKSPGLKVGRGREPGVVVVVVFFLIPWNPEAPPPAAAEEEERPPYKGEPGLAKAARVESREAGKGAKAPKVTSSQSSGGGRYDQVALGVMLTLNLYVYPCINSPGGMISLREVVDQERV